MGDYDDLLAMADSLMKKKKPPRGKRTGRKRTKKTVAISGKGYHYVYHNGKRVLKQRVIMAEIMGRELLSHEAVYFKNGDKTDFAKNNLQLGMKPGRYQTVICPHCDKDIFDGRN